jgi:hypothetical protein
VRDRLLGLLLFLPVPLVLFLFTQAPLGVWTSLGLGVLLMLTHRLYARPFAQARAEHRCLWCGRALHSGRELIVEEPSGVTRWRACGEPHARRALAFLDWSGAHRVFLQGGILGTLVLFLVLAALAAAGLARGARYLDAVNVFRLGIAATVLPLALLAVANRAVSSRVRTPFPVHIQALIGTRAVLWLFRVVGVAWLGLAVVYAVRRFGG